MEELTNLSQPSEFWRHFKDITKIPRCSEHEKEIKNFIEAKAEEYGFETDTDEIGNLVVHIPSKQNGDSITKIILQGHLDMVCEKNKDVEHDFSKDPIQTQVVEISGEKWVKAKGTTLGADNGVGIAYGLTLMEKISKGELEFKNIALDLLFTVDEELELNGAFALDEKMVKGDYLINLDSEEDDSFTVGCAGGIRTYGDIKIKWMEDPARGGNFTPVKLNVKGLQGGHSGADIHKPRGNALKILGMILWKLNQNFELYLSNIQGGNLPNAIPREAEASIYIQQEIYKDVEGFVAQKAKEVKNNIGLEEPDLKIHLQQIDKINDEKIFEKHFSDNLINLLYIIPHGVFSMHPKIEGLVHTSNNFASVKIEDEEMKTVNMERSVSQPGVDMSKEQVTASFLLSDLDVNVHYSDGFPGWEPNFDSKLLQFAKAAYKELFNENPKVEAIHAGLECGILKEKMPETEMISFGPNIKGPHSPDERLEVKSVEKIWNLLKTLLRKFE